jgi:SH3-like domain-containing protein
MIPSRPLLAAALLLLGLALAASSAALAQTTPPQGVLQLPRPGATKSQSAAAPPPPKAAPVTPVQQDHIPQHSVAHKAASKTAAHKPTPVVPTPPPPRSVPATATPTPAPAPEPAKAAKPPPPKPDDTKGTVTGLPLPRWAALRSDEVNLRVGPGTRYPIQWQYHRRDLPVEILREMDVWRLIRDQDGVKGWVHEATLVGHRTFVVQPDEAVLRARAADDAAPVAILKPGVVGRIRSCAANAAWCEVQVRDYRGWLRRNQIWGVSPTEAVN